MKSLADGERDHHGTEEGTELLKGRKDVERGCGHCEHAESEVETTAGPFDVVDSWRHGCVVFGIDCGPLMEQESSDDVPGHVLELEGASPRSLPHFP